MATKKERDSRLAREAFRSVFETNREQGRAPTITQPQSTPEPKSTAQPSRETRKTGLQILLHSARQFGFTHPKHGNFLMLPVEFDAVLALEQKCVAQVVLEVMRQTLGWQDGDGSQNRREWVKLGHRHFERRGIPKSQVPVGLKLALQRGYIIRRPCMDGFEYGVHFAEDPK
jgi:hypothetical protein